MALMSLRSRPHVLCIIAYIVLRELIIYLYTYINLYRKTAYVAKASDTQAVRASSGPLITFLKWVLQYYLEVILYNRVYIIDRLSLKPWMP